MSLSPVTIPQPWLSPYRYGEQKWDEYLIDIRQAVERAGDAASHAAVNQQSAALAAAASLLDSHADRLGNRVEGALSQVTEDVLRGQAAVRDALVDSLDQVSRNIGAGLGMLQSAVERQTEVLEGMAEDLRSVVKILQRPRQTKAQELVEMGAARQRQQLYPEAVRAFTGALELDETNFLAHLHLGRIYLGAVDGKVSLVDLDRAIEAFSLAERYSTLWYENDREALEDAQANVWHYHATAQYLRASEAALAGDTETARRILSNTLNNAPSALFNEGTFLLVRIGARLGAADIFWRALAQLVDKRRVWAGRALNEPDLAELHERVVRIDAELLSNPASWTSQVTAIGSQWMEARSMIAAAQLSFASQVGGQKHWTDEEIRAWDPVRAYLAGEGTGSWIVDVTKQLLEQFRPASKLCWERDYPPWQRAVAAVAAQQKEVAKLEETIRGLGWFNRNFTNEHYRIHQRLEPAKESLRELTSVEANLRAKGERAKHFAPLFA